MMFFYLDVILYAVYLLLAFPSIKKDIEKDLTGDKQEVAIKVILLCVFAFFIFSVVFYLSQAFPIIMFLFLLFNIVNMSLKK